MQARPGTENDNDDEEETIQTCVVSDVRPGSSPSPTPPSSPPTGTQPSREAPSKDPARPHVGSAGGSGSRRGANVTDPEASLITDYQLITDIRVCVVCVLILGYV